MKRVFGLIKKLLVGATILLAAGTLFLEVGSRVYRCPGAGKYGPDMSVCNADEHAVNPQQLEMIQRLSEASRSGVEPSRESLDQVINLVDYEDMRGLNGVICGDGMIFVRGNLGRDARYFVARHELDHAFGIGGPGPACSPGEYCATMHAAAFYPLGFIETIVSSLYISATEAPTVWCWLFGSWAIFRTYILGF